MPLLPNSHILVLSNTEAKELAGKVWTVGGAQYRFKDYTPGNPGWRAGAEGKAYQLLDGASPGAYLKFFNQPSQKRLDRTNWLVAQQLHAWLPSLSAAPLLWADTRRLTRPQSVGFDFAGCLAQAVPGRTWLEMKYAIVDQEARFPDRMRWQCVRDLVLSCAALESQGIVHGDLSANNVVLDQTAAAGPALYLIDFDAFVAPAAGLGEVMTVAEGGTFGTEGYCPPDLPARAERGDLEVAPYSDRHARDMLILELLFMSHEQSPDAAAGRWDKSWTKRRLDAWRACAQPAESAALKHMDFPGVFSMPEHHRPSSLRLAAGLGVSLPPKPPIRPVAPVRPPPRPAAPAPARRRAGARRRAAAALFTCVLAVAVAAAWAYRGTLGQMLSGDSGQGPASPPPAAPVAIAPPQAVLPAVAPPAAPSDVVAPAAPVEAPLPAPVPGTPPITGQTREFTNTLQMRFVRIDAGKFDMGTPTDEVGHDTDETLHHVKISKPFLMATTPVTQAQWTALMGGNPSQFHGERLPVEEVSWNDAVAFCGKLSQKEGKHYRLPTEAEWEYACRAGTTTAFSFGDAENKLDNYGWYASNSGNTTHEVGTKKPNPWQLYDMHGNVWQWCSDIYGPYPGDETDPKGPKQEDAKASRVLRGGSWFNNPRFCRAGYRIRIAPANRYNFIGFRLVLDSE